MNKYYYLLISLCFSLNVYSAGGGGEPSVFDLKWPAINFIILFSFVFFKFKNPLSNLYKEKALSVKESYLNAEEAFKQANLKLEMYKKKSEKN